MVEFNPGQSETTTNAAATTKNKKFFKMVPSERMAGSVPMWGAPDTQKETVMHKIATAAAPPEQSFENALALQSSADDPFVKTGPEEFGFGDLLDMVNPLQHIPVVNSLYREITGDQIKPAAKIVGGGLFGGPAGAASGLINTIVEKETGKDIAGNALNMVLRGETPKLRENHSNDPEQRLNDTIKKMKDPAGFNTLPGELLAFADLGAATQAYKMPHRENAAQGRTAGTHAMRHASEISGLNLPAREAITVISLSDLPK